MTRPDERVSIFVCEGRGDGRTAAEPRLDLLRRLAPGAALLPVKDLCTGSRSLSAQLRRHEGDFVVVLPCASHRGAPRVDGLREHVAERAAAGTWVVIDPGDLLAAGADEADEADQQVKLGAVVAAAAALSGSRVAGVFNGATPVVAGVNRRALLTGRLRASRPRPTLDADRCAASPRCRRCVERCPTSALTMDGGALVVDSARCDGCGACVLACPKDLLRISTLPRRTWEMFLRHALVGAREIGLPLGVWWSCADADESPDRGAGAAWMRLRLPCVRALTPAWILQPLARGAAHVTVTSCAAASDEWAPDAPMSRLLDALSANVRVEPAASTLTLREPAGTVEALRQIPFGEGSFVDSERAPTGVISCVAQSCTSCGVCVERCPAKALKASEHDASWSLAFAHANCIACGACVACCPEHALALRRGVDPAGLGLDRQLVSTPLSRCDVCGARLPSPAMVARLAALGVRLDDDGRCNDCRARDRSVRRTG